MNTRDVIIQRLTDVGGRLRVRSALNPILWLCGLVTMPCINGMAWTGQFNGWLAFTAAAPLICAMFGFLFLLFNDRDKLQSEEYQIRKQAIELIEQKGDMMPHVMAVVDVVPNPELPPPSNPQLPSSQES